MKVNLRIGVGHNLDIIYAARHDPMTAFRYPLLMVGARQKGYLAAEIKEALTSHKLFFLSGRFISRRPFRSLRTEQLNRAPLGASVYNSKCQDESRLARASYIRCARTFTTAQHPIQTTQLTVVNKIILKLSLNPSAKLTNIADRL